MMDIEKVHRVLEIGTGSGYPAAILSSSVKEVYTIDIVPQLAKSASETLNRKGSRNVIVREGDGYKGWPETALFDGIILTAAPPDRRQTLTDQLKARLRKDGLPQAVLRKMEYRANLLRRH